MTTPADLIAEHNKLDDYITAENKRFAEHIKPVKERLAAIEAELQNQLNALNAGKPESKRASISTEAGTAYLSTIMTPKVADKEKYLDWVLDAWDSRGAMLQIGQPQKDALREYMDTNDGQTPPFVTVEYFTRTNIRRS